MTSVIATPVIRSALPSDLQRLIQIEHECFSGDRLSSRSLKHHTSSSHSLLLVAILNDELVAYGLVLLHRGTRLARLYSLAVSKAARGTGLGQSLLQELEAQASEQNRLYMRLEVAETNQAAIQLYQRLGYKIFGHYSNYYQDHSDALRMQKRIRSVSVNGFRQTVPWYQQTTEFTCGPSSLMMAMTSQSDAIQPDQSLELALWREATTIFMTSGHGGCHPIGLGLSAARRGFEVQVYLSHPEPLFIHGVRSIHKKSIMTRVDADYKSAACEQGLDIIYADIQQQQIEQWLKQGFAVVMLISTYRLEGRKIPHWVVITAVDDDCIYLHDPDPIKHHQSAIDCQYIPIARNDFDKMSVFGRDRLRTAIVLRAAAKASCA